MSKRDGNQLDVIRLSLVFAVVGFVVSGPVPALMASHAAGFVYLRVSNRGVHSE